MANWMFLWIKKFLSPYRPPISLDFVQSFDFGFKSLDLNRLLLHSLAGPSDA
jgi:hypothetical protein